MKINKIIINNYRRIYGEEIIDLSGSNDKNINLFFGANGSGKSTIYNAIFLALYGVEVKLEEATKKEPLINKKYLNEKTKGEICSLEVALDIEFDLKNYIISRKINIKNDPDIRFYVKEHSIHKWAFKPISQKDELIIKIISKTHTHILEDPLGFIQKEFPMDLAPFYLVDGDSVNDLEDRLGIQIATAVKEYSGMKLAGDTVDHLDRMIPRITSSNVTNDEIEELIKNLDKLTDKLIGLKKNKDTIEKEYIRAKDEYDTFIKNSNYDEIEKLKEDLRILQSDLLSIEKEEAIQSDNLKSYYQNVFNYFLIGDKVEKWIKEYDTLKEKGDVPQDITKGFLRNLLNEELCICGECLTSNYSERLKNINNLIEKKVDVDQNEVATIKSKITSGMDEAKELDLKNLDKEYRETLGKIDKLNSAISIISKEIDASVEKLKEGSGIASRFRIAENKFNTIKKEIGDLEDDIKFLEKKIHELSGEISESDINKLKKSLFEIIRSSINNQVQNFENSKRKEISQKLPQQTKDAELFIDEKWLISQKYKADNTSKGLSAGQALSSYLQYFSILLSELTSFEHKRFPIIIDSPSGKIDSKKTKDTYKTVFDENKSSQIIMFCTDKEWSSDLNSLWIKRLGKSFIINTDSDEYGKYKEGDWETFANYMSIK